MGDNVFCTVLLYSGYSEKGGYLLKQIPGYILTIFSQLINSLYSLEENHRSDITGDFG
jgi:hypothetical protein